MSALNAELMNANPAKKWLHRALLGAIGLMLMLAAASVVSTALWLAEGGWPQVRSNFAEFGKAMLAWPNLLLLGTCIALAVGSYKLLICRYFPAYRLTFVLALLAMFAGQWAYELAMIGSAPSDPSFSPQPGGRAGHALTFSLMIVAILPISSMLGFWLKQRRAHNA